MAALPNLVTVEQFHELPDGGNHCYQRWNALQPEVDLQGAPELVIEVLSPSNTQARLRETVPLCPADGAWNAGSSTANASPSPSSARTAPHPLYEGDTEIPLTAFGSDFLRVADIFE
jgi:hypothetical protein